MYHEHPVRACRLGPLVMQVRAERVEEPVRGRDHSVMAALALHHGQPPVSDLNVLELWNAEKSSPALNEFRISASATAGFGEPWKTFTISGTSTAIVAKPTTTPKTALVHLVAFDHQ